MNDDVNATMGRILVADDEETFLQSTADLLRREGYVCDTVTDASAAAEMLRQHEYDLLIADIKMPGNPNLELIRQLPDVAGGLPAILVTGYPSVESAVHSLQLPVAAYLVKPVDFPELLGHVRVAVARYRLFTTLRRVRGRLKHWQDDLNSTEEMMRQTPGSASPVPIDVFLDLTLGNIVASLSDLRGLIEGLQNKTDGPQACHLLDCPRPAVFIKALREVIDVLRKTKSAFKSKELGELREKLEKLVDTVE